MMSQRQLMARVGTSERFQVAALKHVGKIESFWLLKPWGKVALCSCANKKSHFLSALDYCPLCGEVGLGTTI